MKSNVYLAVFFFISIQSISKNGETTHQSWVRSSFLPRVFSWHFQILTYQQNFFGQKISPVRGYRNFSRKYFPPNPATYVYDGLIISLNSHSIIKLLCIHLNNSSFIFCQSGKHESPSFQHAYCVTLEWDSHRLSTFSLKWFFIYSSV